ncbi:MAG TPA: hypothetical protein VFT74_04335 [Isosphaeraceae bacterium]|nr:hypothetical protein [Isosphaeraceae bacterium]
MTKRRGMIGMLVLVGGLAAPVAVKAQDAVLVIRSAGELLDDVQYLAKATVSEDQAGQVMGMVQNLKQQGLQGLDLTKPIGLLGSLPKQAGEAPMIVAAIPTKDVGALLQSLQGLGLQSQPFQGEPGFTHQVMLPDGNTSLYVTSSADYAYFSMVPSGAKEIQALTPSVWAPKRPGAGDVSLTVRLDKLPPQMKQSVIDAVAQQAAAEQDRKPGESDSEYQGRLVGMKMAGEAVTRFLQDAGQVALDLAIDQTKGEMSLALSTSAKSGTPMAKAISGFAGRRSRFSALGSRAPMAGWASFPIPKEFQELMGKLVEEGRKKALEEAENETEKKIAGEVIDALQPTLSSDALDLGMSVQLAEGGKSVLVGGMQVVDGKKIETALRDALKASPPKDDTKVTLDAAKAADGTSIHKIQGKVDENTAKMFGKDAALYLAFQDDLMMVVLGEKGEEAMKKALGSASDRPAATALPPAALVVHAAKLAPFAQQGADTDAEREAMTKAAGEVFQGANASKDLLRVSVQGEGDTVFLKVSCDVPVLSFFAKVGMAQQQQLAAPNQ